LFALVCPCLPLFFSFFNKFVDLTIIIGMLHDMSGSYLSSMYLFVSADTFCIVIILIVLFTVVEYIPEEFQNSTTSTFTAKKKKKSGANDRSF
jgi:hypothetical protein